MDKKKLFEFCFGVSPEEMPGRVIVTPFIPLKKFKEHCHELSSFKGRFYSGFTAEQYGCNFGVVYCGVGDRLLGDAILLLEEAGGDSVIFAGSCGGLKDVAIGDIVICEKAFNGEGFTRHLKEDSDIRAILNDPQWGYADKALGDVCKKIIDQQSGPDIKCEKGSIFTTGSLLVETDENLNILREEGFTGIEMEVSAVYGAAATAGIKAVAILYVSDLPGEKELWELLNDAQKLRYDKGFRQLVRMSVECITGKGEDK